MNIPRHNFPPALQSPPDDPNLYGVNLTLDVPDGDDSARAMVQVMRAIVHDSDRRGYVLMVRDHVVEQSEKMRKLPMVLRLAEDLQQKTCDIAKLVALHNALARAQIFTRDPKRTDMPRHVDQLCYEILRTSKCKCDCDCLAMLGAAIARRMGFETGFVLVGDTPDDRLRHVFYAIKLRGSWRPFDPQTNTPPFVWPVRAVRREIVSVDS